jgi:hypothetical protein
MYTTGVSWGDYDNDGDLDLVFAGTPDAAPSNSRIYNNGGGGAFTDIGAGLAIAAYPSVAWGDYDNDGDLDLLLAGYDTVVGDGRTRIYRNNGNGTFTNIGAALPGIYTGVGAWGDFDNDGDLDILLMGFSGTGNLARVYRNDGGGTFTDIGAGLPALYDGSAAWGDFDNDGDLDILLSGNAGTEASPTPVSVIFRNNGDGTFSDINAGLTGVWKSSAAWGDYDNDGDLDIVLMGNAGSNDVPHRITRIYRNDGGGVFTDIGAGLPGVNTGAVAWGDYDNDGDLDLLLTGYTGTGGLARVYRNDGGGSFTDIGAGLTAGTEIPRARPRASAPSPTDEGACSELPTLAREEANLVDYGLAHPGRRTMHAVLVCRRRILGFIAVPAAHHAAASGTAAGPVDR